ncbi:putative signal transducing protein [Epilithonimonas sp. UC225_85]|uniref:putative signal transducing protein n=1 Tax=Epilithonimonas sp. UC225_85 TaxID=3350167 RepID=UPI0036D38FD5
MELITLKIFNTEIEAEMLRIFLETNEVEAFVFGNVLANTYNLFNTTSGGVQLKVSENDFEKANNLMTEFYNKDN